jgi:hypothetical protein
MKELVGHCFICQKEVFCMDGFFQGEVSNSGETLCFICAEKKEKESNDEAVSNS